MRFSPFVRYLVCAGLLVCLGLAGCRTSPRYRRESALLRAEILDVEDKYALLKSKYMRVARELSELTGEPVDLDLGAGTSTSYPMDETYYLAPGEVLEDQLLYSSPQFVDPQIPQEQGTVPDTGNSPSVLQEPDASNSPAPSVEGADDPNIIPMAGPSGLPSASHRVTEVAIHPQASGGHSVDGKPGDEGIKLLIQPRRSDGQVHLQPGELTVSLVDRQSSNRGRRIGLWKFVAEETELFFVNDDLNQQGILLRLPWRETAPTGQQLIAHVRLVTPDGRVLRTSQEFRITPPGADYTPDSPAIEEWILQGRPPQAGGLIAAPSVAEGQERLVSPTPRQRRRIAQPDAPQWRPVR